MQVSGRLASVGLVVAALCALPAGPAGARTTAVAGGSAAATGAAATVGPAGVRVAFHRIVTGLAAPVFVASPRDGSGRLFVVEQGGTVREVAHGTVRSRVYLDLRQHVVSGGEQGLLSIAFHPRFHRHPVLYAAYTRKSDGALQVSRFRARRAGADHVAASTERRILAVPHPDYTNHNAGQLVFGRHGLLLVSTGDGGGGGDPFDHARDLTSLSGKILRLDVDRSCGRRRYCVPAGNPFAHARNAHKRLVFDWGLRNAWRFSADRRDGRLWIGDVGQDRYEEIDHVRQRGGKDFGWSCREGRSSYDADRCTIGGHPRHMTGPVHVYAHTHGRCAVIGGYAYRGPRRPFAHGIYVYGDYCGGQVYGLAERSDGSYRNARIGTLDGVTGFGEAANGELLAVTGGGELDRLVFRRR